MFSGLHFTTMLTLSLETTRWVRLELVIRHTQVSPQEVRRNCNGNLVLTAKTQAPSISSNCNFALILYMVFKTDRTHRIRCKYFHFIDLFQAWGLEYITQWCHAKNVWCCQLFKPIPQKRPASQNQNLLLGRHTWFWKCVSLGLFESYLLYCCKWGGAAADNTRHTPSSIFHPFGYS